MSMMEMATVYQNNLDIKMVIMKNNRLGLVREMQKNDYSGNYTAVSLGGVPDFMKIAQAYGVQASSVCHNTEIDSAVEQLLFSKGPYLLECIVRPDEPSL